ncbi:HAD family hydrolase [Chitinophagaceae bacterium LWZ2-11]
MNKIELAIFDMAGTTVLDKGNVNEAFRNAFNKAGIEVKPADVDKVMGYRKIEAVQIIVDKYLPHLEEDEATALINQIHEDFTTEMVKFYETTPELAPLPYAEECFELLQSKGVKVALNTGFTRVITNAILQRLGWDKTPFINIVVCSDEVEEGRPHPYMINAIMNALSVKEASSVAKTGDTEVDINEGRNADCGLVVAVTTGAYTRDELAACKPDYIINSLQEFPALIL